MPKPIYFVGAKPQPNVQNIIISEIVYLNANIDLRDIDTLLFTSKNGVIGLDSSISGWQTIPAFVIGESTANEVKKRGGKVEFISLDSHGSGFFAEVRDRLFGRHVLYPRAKEIVSQIGSKLQNINVNLREAIVYENRPIRLDESQKPPKNSILIFSAPSAYRYFLYSFKWDCSFQAVAIGRTTLEAFDKDVNAHLAENVSIDSCIELAKKLSNE